MSKYLSLVLKYKGNGMASDSQIGFEKIKKIEKGVIMG